MANFASGTYNGLRGLLETVVADDSGSKPLIPATDNASVLGPSVGDDAAPAPNITLLGPRVEGGLAKSVLTVLGPCVGDD